MSRIRSVLLVLQMDLPTSNGVLLSLQMVLNRAQAFNNGCKSIFSIFGGGGFGRH